MYKVAGVCKQATTLRVEGTWTRCTDHVSAMSTIYMVYDRDTHSSASMEDLV